MIRTAEGICSAYKNLNRDLLISGVLFHDCGKMWENTYPKGGFTMPYDFRAELTGHISIGAEIVNTLYGIGVSPAKNTAKNPQEL